MNTPKIATLIAAFTAVSLAILKLVVGIVSGSVSVLASAIDSLLDVIISAFNFFALSKSEQPANTKYNYGFGKIESLASFIEGVIIALSGLYILYEAIDKLINGGEIRSIDVGVWVMSGSFAITLLLVIFLSRVAKKSRNQVIQADLLHYKTDLLSNGVVLLSLLVVRFFGYESVDAILGVCIAVYIIYNAFVLMKNGVYILLDRSITEELRGKIVDILENSAVSSYHELKSRIVGDKVFVEVHLVFDTIITLKSAHDIADEIEKKIPDLDPSLKWEVITHLDPEDDREKE